MKNWKTRLIVFAFLAFTSIMSYSYLNMANSEQPIKNSLYSTDIDSTEENEVYMLDVEMIEKIFEAGKKLRAFGAG